MRFKKLRLYVGIAIVLFILIAGNIIAFGLLHKNQTQPALAVIDNKKTLNVPVVNSYSTTTTSNNANSNTNTVNSNTGGGSSVSSDQQAVATPPPVVYHPSLRTRAS